MTTSRDYWRRREQENLKKNLKSEAEYAKELNRICSDAMDNIQKEIDAFYGRYAGKEGITIAEAKKRVSKLDIEAYSRKAEKYVREKDLSKQANEEMRLYNLTMKVNRLEMLKAQIGLELVSSFDEMQKFFEQKLTDRTTEEFERQAGILGESVGDVTLAASSIVGASFHNATFSQRIWANQDLLKSEISKLLQTGMIQGRHPDVLARELRKQIDVSRFNSERLMRTEMARVQTEAQMQSFERYGFEEYEYMACHYGDVCAACKALDGKHFKTKDAMPGENAPPMHPFCHCSTCAWLDEEKYSQWLDSYSDHGLSFREWQERNVVKPEIKLVNAGLKQYTENEIKAMAEDVNLIADKHIPKRSKWSGNIIIDDKADLYGKLWNCDIATKHETSGHILLHEQLHSRSISYYDPQTYAKYQNIEEASVQFMTREISKVEGIEIIASEYDELVDRLSRINQKAGIASSDYEFAKQLFLKPVPERLEWIEGKISEAMRNGGIIKLYNELNDLIEGLY